jgi:hypothetical protein
MSTRCALPERVDVRLVTSFRQKPGFYADIAAVALATFVVTVVIESFAVSRLSPLSHQISEYANDPGTGWIITAGFAAWTIAFAASAGATQMAADRPMRRTFSAIFLVAAAATLLLTVCHTQTVAGRLPPGEHLTLRGALHDVGSGVTTVSLFILAIVAAFMSDDRVVRLASRTTVVGAVSVDIGLLIAGSGVGGLRERVLLAIGCSWQWAYVRSLKRNRSSTENDSATMSLLNLPN